MMKFTTTIHAQANAVVADYVKVPMFTLWAPVAVCIVVWCILLMLDVLAAVIA